MVAYIDGEVDRVEMFYNGYVSPLTQELRRETLLPLQDATILEGGEHDVDERRRTDERRATASTRSSSTSRAPTRSSSASSRTTSRSRSTARCWRAPHRSSARA